MHEMQIPHNPNVQLDRSATLETRNLPPMDYSWWSVVGGLRDAVKHNGDKKFPILETGFSEILMRNPRAYGSVVAKNDVGDVVFSLEPENVTTVIDSFRRHNKSEVAPASMSALIHSKEHSRRIEKLEDTYWYMFDRNKIVGDTTARRVREAKTAFSVLSELPDETSPYTVRLKREKVLLSDLDDEQSQLIDSFNNSFPLISRGRDYSIFTEKLNESNEKSYSFDIVDVAEIVLKRLSQTRIDERATEVWKEGLYEHLRTFSLAQTENDPTYDRAKTEILGIIGLSLAYVETDNSLRKVEAVENAEEAVITKWEESLSKLLCHIGGPHIKISQDVRNFSSNLVMASLPNLKGSDPEGLEVMDMIKNRSLELLYKNALSADDFFKTWQWLYKRFPEIGTWDAVSAGMPTELKVLNISDTEFRSKIESAELFHTTAGKVRLANTELHKRRKELGGLSDVELQERLRESLGSRAYSSFIEMYDTFKSATSLDCAPPTLIDICSASNLNELRTQFNDMAIDGMEPRLVLASNLFWHGRIEPVRKKRHTNSFHAETYAVDMKNFRDNGLLDYPWMSLEAIVITNSAGDAWTMRVLPSDRFILANALSDEQNPAWQPTINEAVWLASQYATLVTKLFRVATSRGDSGKYIRFEESSSGSNNSGILRAYEPSVHTKDAIREWLMEYHRDNPKLMQILESQQRIG